MLQPQCPHAADTPLARDDRVSHVSPFPLVPGPVFRDPTSGEWYISNAQAARAVLREPNAGQAGFEADNSPNLNGHRSIIHLSGERHLQLRKKVAKLFSPKTTREKYEPMMRAQAKRAMHALQHSEQPLDRVAMEYSVAVAREIVGVTESPLPRLSKRMDALFVDKTPTTRLGDLWYQVTQISRLIGFYVKDLRPAIRARRAEPREDLVSLLIAEKYPTLAIALECITYAAAGMVTTREFISVATWQLLRNESLRSRYVQSDAKARLRVLTEILRVEPIVRGLSRDLVRDLELEVQGSPVTIPAGARVHLCIPMLNVQEDIAGPCPHTINPDRTLTGGFPEDVLAFGAGPHRCPGAAIALQETDIFLHTLLQLPVKLRAEPSIGLQPVAASLSLRGLDLCFEASP